MSHMMHIILFAPKPETLLRVIPQILRCLCSIIQKLSVYVMPRFAVWPLHAGEKRCVFHRYIIIIIV